MCARSDVQIKKIYILDANVTISADSACSVGLGRRVIDLRVWGYANCTARRKYPGRSHPRGVDTTVCEPRVSRISRVRARRVSQRRPVLMSSLTTGVHTRGAAPRFRKINDGGLRNRRNHQTIEAPRSPARSHRDSIFAAISGLRRGHAQVAKGG